MSIPATSSVFSSIWDVAEYGCAIPKTTLVSPLKWRGTFGGIMEVKWSFWTQIGGSKSAIYISILPYIAPVMKQIHLFANKFDQSNIYDYELVFILTGSSLLIIAEW